MKYITRDGKIEGKDSLQDRFLQAVYGSRAGRWLIRPFISPAVSRLGGWFLDQSLSCFLIRPFVRSSGIDLSLCEKQEFDSYNDFFTRKLKACARRIDRNPDHFISPCDSRLSVYRIGEGLRVPVKQTWYRVADLLRDEALAKRFDGGYLFVYRLCVDDYHRYVFPDSGYQTGFRKIKGVLHTVNPAANDVCPIYKENSREYGILHSDHFGTLLMMEVGAMMVGRIENHPGHKRVRRGEEKGYFAFGGSTILVMTQKDRVNVAKEILNHSAQGLETRVLLGEMVGTAAGDR
ncbi:MAG: phosphatidylserine decarboxylase [Lachnospiraceae bacterium]|nr:phosphatidylserine decarboxylase [Lachnospiraceae bacterium]